jgi:hypothetical protein
LPLALGLAHYYLLPGDIGLKTPYEPSLWDNPPATGIWVGPSGVAEARRLTGSNLVVFYRMGFKPYFYLELWLPGSLGGGVAGGRGVLRQVTCKRRMASPFLRVVSPWSVWRFLIGGV